MDSNLIEQTVFASPPLQLQPHLPSAVHTSSPLFDSVIAYSAPTLAAAPAAAAPAAGAAAAAATSA